MCAAANAYTLSTALVGSRLTGMLLLCAGTTMHPQLPTLQLTPTGRLLQGQQLPMQHHLRLLPQQPLLTRLLQTPRRQQRLQLLGGSR